MTPSEGVARLRRRKRAGGPRVAPPSADPAAVAAKATLLRRLELDVTRRLDGMLSGDYLAFATGPGSEPAGARPYGPGDDARRIDWNLTARALSPHVRTTEADRELETRVLVDRSASLDFGTAHREKREVALATVAAFGFLTVRAGNRLGVLVTGGDELVSLPARAGRLGVLAALSVLYDTPRRETPPAPEADLAAALVRLEGTQRRRGQVIVVSDFLDASDWAAPLRRLAMRHHVVAAQVTDPRELRLPAVGMMALVDAETGEHLYVQTNSAGLRERYAAVAAQRQLRIGRLLADAGAEHLRLSTDRDWLLDVVRFVGRRRGDRLQIRALGRGVTLPGYERAAGAHEGPRPGGGT
ncbi:MAG TPA: DUF58 domain-containing protein [Acidimicrobiales bacterium]|nr:DUF58 domain-containing protein [Acidimicrobiales bacterium]